MTEASDRENVTWDQVTFSSLRLLLAFYKAKCRFPISSYFALPRILKLLFFVYTEQSTILLVSNSDDLTIRFLYCVSDEVDIRFLILSFIRSTKARQCSVPAKT